MSDFDAIKRWLPHPFYRFVGGPADGRNIAVAVIETDRGMIPLEYVRVAEPVPLPKLPKRTAGIQPVAHSLSVHTYRFVPDPAATNGGYYEWITPA